MKYLIVLFVSTLLLSNCKKPPSCNGNYNDLPDSVLNYWYFPSGSYWIYKAKGLDLYDSVYVTETMIENFDDDIDGALICAKSYSIIREHSLYEFTNGNFREKFHSTFFKGGAILYVNKECSNCNVSVNYEPLYFIERREDLPSGIITKDTSINNIVYNNIWFTNRLLLAPNVGVIKFELSDGLIWELIDYKIQNK